MPLKDVTLCCLAINAAASQFGVVVKGLKGGNQDIMSYFGYRNQLDDLIYIVSKWLIMSGDFSMVSP